MTKRKIHVETEKRYKKLLSDPKHRPRKTKNKRRHEKALNLMILAAIVYAGVNMVPKKDKEEFAELLGTLPAELATAGPQAAGSVQTANLSSVLAAFIPEAPRPTTSMLQENAGIAPAATAQPAEPKGFVGDVLSMNDFPRAHDNWDRTDFRTAEAAAQALQQMDRFLDSQPVEIAPVGTLRDRKAALYQDGANLRFLIMVEAARPGPRQEVKTAAAGPAPAVMTDMPGAMSVPRAELSVDDAPSQARIARVRAGGAGPRTVALAGISFTDHARDPSRNLVDLRAQLPGDRAIYVRGRAPRTVIEEFLSRTDLSGLGLNT